MTGLVPLYVEKTDLSLCAHTPRKVMGGHSKKAAVYRSGSGLSPGTKSANNLILDFPASITILFKCPVFDICHSSLS